MNENRTPTSSDVGDTWDAGSAGWIANADLVDRMSAPVRSWLVEQVNPEPGQTILELAAGAGDTGIEIAQRVAPDGKVISTDISPSMIRAAQQRAGQRGVTNAEFHVMDAQRIELDEACVDGVVHKYGPMLLPDPDASFKEVRRVLRPGGRYACAVWAGPDRNPWIPLGALALMEHGLQPPAGDPTGPGGMFSFADPDVLRSRIASAGFDDVRVEFVENPFILESFDEYWKLPSEVAAPIAAIIRSLDEPQREAVKASYRKLAEPHADGEKYKPSAVTICAIAR